MKELIEIQNEIKVKKERRNEFGGFNYRNLEDINEAIKPLLKDKNCTLTFSDSLVELGGSVYVEATATIKNSTGEIESAKAYAREEKARPKMAEPQLTGGASSYARKYAINGLLLLDDTADPDSLDNRQKGSNPKEADASIVNPNKITEKQISLIREIAEKHPDLGLSGDTVILESGQEFKINDLTKDKADNFIKLYGGK